MWCQLVSLSRLEEGGRSREGFTCCVACWDPTSCSTQASLVRGGLAQSFSLTWSTTILGGLWGLASVSVLDRLTLCTMRGLALGGRERRLRPCNA